MRSRCPNCNALSPAGAISCSDCGIQYSQWDREQADRLEELSQQQARDIAKMALRMMWKPLVSVASFVSLIFGFGLWQTCQYVEEQIQQRFADPQVARTFTDVANEKAREIIANRVEPTIDAAQQQVRAEVESLSTDLAAFRAAFDRQLQEVKAENAYQKELRKIQGLEDAARMGSYKAYEALRNYRSDNRELLSRALSAAQSAKADYIGRAYFSSAPLTAQRASGDEVQEDQMTTEELLGVVESEKNHLIRARAARKLASHPYLGVPEQLLAVIDSDESLWVRTAALDSFSAMTGFHGEDVFAFDKAKAWFAENQERVNAGLQKSPSVDQSHP